jgi:hypothetical protein
MAIGIPGFASQIILDTSVDGVIVTTGTAQVMDDSIWYYFVSNRTTAANGMSLLHALKLALEASLAGTTWTVKLSAGYKVQLSHDNGASRTATLDSSLATALGFTAAAQVVAAGTAVTADYPSVWWWSPGQAIGDADFHVEKSAGIPKANGAMHRAPDGTPASVSNGILYDSSLKWFGIEGYYKIRAESGYTNQDLETWWKNGAAKGRRYLWWRSRDNAIGSAAPSEGSATPYNYVECSPADSMRAGLPAAKFSPPSINFWDVTFDYWITENGETPLTD